MRRGTYDNSHNRNRTRIDARNQADPYVQAGVRNIHRDTRGNVIGGTTAEGQRLRGGGFRTPPAMSNPDYVPAATGNVLNQRKNLFKSMEAAGPDKLTAEMRANARSMGVTDTAFNAAAGRMKTNSYVTPKATPPAQGQPANQATPVANTLVSQTTMPTPKATPPVSKIDGVPASQAIAKAKIGAEAAWKTPQTVMGSPAPDAPTPSKKKPLIISDGTPPRKRQ